MNAPNPQPTPTIAAGRFMSGADYRDSLRRYKPLVYVDGQRIDSVADAPQLQPGAMRWRSATTSRATPPRRR